MKKLNKKSILLLGIAAVVALCVIAFCIVLGVNKPTITLSETAVTMDVMDTLELEADTTNAFSWVSWKSADKTVATVKGGKITAVKAGVTEVTASVRGVKAICKVTVVDSKTAPVLELSHNNVTLGLKNSFTTQAKVLWKGEYVEDDIDYTWQLDDSGKEDVASMKATKDQATITALKYGETAYKVTAKYRGTILVAKLSVCVTNIDVIFDSPNMELSSGCYAVNLGLVETKTDKTHLTPKVSVYEKEQLVKDPKFEWTIEDDSIATIDENGKIKAKKAGVTYAIGKYKDSELKIQVTVYRTQFKKDPIYIEKVRSYVVSPSWLSGMKVEDAFFNGTSIIASKGSVGSARMKVKKLPEIGNKGELVIQTEKAEYIMDAMVVTRAIYTWSDLRNIASTIKTNAGSGYYVLANDIKCTGTYDSKLKVEFKGTFDGQGHAIYNMKTSSRTGANRGLLGETMGADGVLKNISFVNAKHSGQGGFIVKSASGLMENVYIQIDVSEVTEEQWDGATSVLASVTTGAFATKSVLIEYNPALPRDAATGYPVWPFYYGYGKFQGLFAIGAKDVGVQKEDLKGGLKDVYGAYANYGEFLAAGKDVSEWDDEFWSTANGIPYPKNLGTRKGVVPKVKIPKYVGTDSKVTIEGLTIYDRVIVNSTMSRYGIKVKDGELVIPKKVPSGTKLYITVQSAFDASKRTVLKTTILKSHKVTISTYTNVELGTVKNFTIDLSAQAKTIGSGTLTDVTVDGIAFNKKSYKNGVLTLDAASLESLGEKTVQAMFKNKNTLIIITIPVDACTLSIENEADLNKMASVITKNKGEGRYVLANDIHCTGIYDSKLEKEFTGTFDGHGLTIYNLTTSDRAAATRGLLGQSLGSTGVVRNTSFVGAKHSGMGGFIVTNAAGLMENLYIQIDITNPTVGSYDAATSVLASGTFGVFSTNNVLIEYPNRLPASAPNGYGVWQLHYGYAKHQGLYAVGANRVYCQKNDLGAGLKDVYGAFKTYADVKLSWKNDFWATKNGVPYPKHLGAPKAVVPNVTMSKYVGPNSKVDIGGLTIYDKVVLSSAMTKLGLKVSDGKLTIPKSVPLGTTIKVTVQSAFDSAKKVTLTAEVLSSKNVTLKGIYDAAIYNNETFAIDFGAKASEVEGKTFAGATIDGTKFTDASFENDVLTLDTATLSELGEQEIQAQFKNDSELVNVTIKVDVCTMSIKTEADLNAMAAVIEAEGGEGRYVLADDITCVGTYNAGITTPFVGTFDGKGHTIYNLQTANEENDMRGFFGQSFGKTTDGSTPIGVMKNVSFVGAKHSGQGGFIAANGSGKLENVYVQIAISNCNQNSYQWATASLVASMTPAMMTDKVFVEYSEPLEAGVQTGYPFWLAYTDFTRHTGLYAVGVNKLYANGQELGIGQTNEWGAFDNYYALQNGTDLAWNDDFWTTTNGIPYPKNLPAREGVVPNARMIEIATAGMKVPIEGLTIFDRVVLDADMIDLGVTVVGNMVQIPQLVEAGTEITVKIQSALDPQKVKTLTTKVLGSKNVTLEGHYAAAVYNKTSFDIPVGETLAAEIGNGSVLSAITEGKAFTSMSYADGKITLDTATFNELGDKTVTVMLQGVSNIITIEISVDVCTYAIASEADLNGMAAVIQANNGEGRYILTSHIFCEGKYNANITTAFTGTFDGHGYAIYNMQTETATPGTAADTHTRGFFGLQFGNSTDGSTPIGVMKNVSFINAKHNGMGGFIAAKGSGKMENVYIQLTLSDLRGNASGSYEYTTTSLVASPSTAFMTSKVLVEYKEPLASTAVVGYPFWATYTDFTRHDGLYVVGAAKLYTIGNTLNYGQPNAWGAYADYNALKAAVTLDWNNDFWTTKEGIPTPKKQAKSITMEGTLDVGLNKTEFTVDLSGKASELTGATLQSVKVDGAAFAQQKFEGNVLTLDVATLGTIGQKTLVATILLKDGNTMLITQNLNVCTMVITTEADLKAMPQTIAQNGGDGVYVLGADITCTGTYNANIDTAFIGTFDGKGHVIKNMQTETATPGTAADTHTRGFFGLQFGNSTDGSTPIGVMKNVSFINAKHNGMGGFIAAKGSGKMENVYIQITLSDLRGNASGSYEYTTTSLVASPSTAFMTSKVLVEYKEPLASTAVVGYPFWATYTDFTRHDGLYVVGAAKLYTIGNTLNYGQPNEWGAFDTYDALKDGTNLNWNNEFWKTVDGVPTPKSLAD